MCAGVGSVLGRMSGAGDTGGTADVAGAVLLAAGLSFSTLTGAACCCCPAVVGGVEGQERVLKSQCPSIHTDYNYIKVTIESTFGKWCLSREGQ